MKTNLYEAGEQYNKKASLWEAIKTTMSEIKPDEENINRING